MSEKARIRRGGAPRHKRSGPPRRATAPRKPRVDRAPVASSIPAAKVRRWIGYGVFAAGLAFVSALLVAIKLPQMIGIEIGEAAGRAGFVVKHIEPRGLKHIDRMEVYAAAIDQQSMAMPLVDLDAIRARLLRNGWVEDARVSRRLPDTLLVDIVERTPAAIWQYRQRLVLVDRSGVVLAPVDVSAMPDLPLVIGPDANRHTAYLATLTEAAPSLKPMLAGATWVGGRRWDLLFQSGETLALPEGEGEARQALVRFARLDQLKPLLGQGFVRFDMRIEGKLYARVSSEPGALIPAKPKPAPVARDNI